MEAIVKKGVIDGCRSEKDLINRYERLSVAMNHTIETEKLLTQCELSDGRLSDELTVCIDRDGNFLLGNGGHHRLAIAKALDLPINVLVHMTHENFLNLENAL